MHGKKIPRSASFACKDKVVSEQATKMPGRIKFVMMLLLALVRVKTTP
jgi:hypothetical protein